jgi:hypothetical protein
MKIDSPAKARANTWNRQPFEVLFVKEVLPTLDFLGTLGAG